MVIETPERLDLEVSDSLRSQIKALVEKQNFRLVFDMSRTRYLDSTGLSALMSRIALARSKGGDMRLAGPSDFVLGILELTNLNKIIKCYDDVKSALESFRT